MSSGPSTAPARSGAQDADPDSVRGRWVVVCGLLLALLTTPVHAAEPAGAGEMLRTPGPKDHYRRFAVAWQARDAAGVVAGMEKRGALTLRLLSPDLSGTYRQAQAQRTLQQYFGGISEVGLKDVTPKRYPTKRGWAVRFYDYTYRARGRDPVTTRLKVTMKGDGRGHWHLNDIEESRKR